MNEDCKNVSSKEFINLNDTIFTVFPVHANEYQGGIIDECNIRAILLFTSISSRLSLLFEEKVEHRFEYYSLVYAPTRLL